MRVPAESGSNGGEKLRLEKATGMVLIFCIKRSIVMLMINVTADAVAYGAAH